MKSTKPSASAQVEAEAVKKGINVKMASSRPPTILGKQGDHVSAYTLFKRCVIAAVENADIDDAPKLILQIIDSYIGTEDSQKYFGEFKETLKRDMFLNSTELETIIDALDANSNVPKDLVKKVGKNIIRSNTQYLEKILSKLIETHLTLRNKVALTAFPAEGNVEPPRGEGNRVKKAIKTLKDIKEVNNKNISDVIDKVKDLFWYPKIPEDTIIDLNSEDGKNRWDKVKKNYRSGVKPRDNDISTLGQVIANHVELIFSCFKGLQGRRQNDIINDLINKTDTDWELTEKEHKQVVDIVSQELPYYISELKSDESRSASYTASETGESSSSKTGSDEDSSQYWEGDYNPGDSQHGLFKEAKTKHKISEHFMESLTEKLDELEIFNQDQNKDEDKDGKLNP